jgi:hypothetical protein
MKMSASFDYDLLLVDQKCIFLNQLFHSLAPLLAGFEIFGSSVENPCSRSTKSRARGLKFGIELSLRFSHSEF